MGDVVNFNKAKKAQAKRVAQVAADANRAKFGRTKAEKLRDKVEAGRAAKIVDGAKLDDI